MTSSELNDWFKADNVCARMNTRPRTIRSVKARANTSTLQRWAMWHFLLAIVITILWGLTACQAPVKNGCVIQAVGFQDALIAKGELDKNQTWNELLFVKRVGNPIRHCVNIFRSKAGRYYWHDADHGSTQLQGITAANVMNPEKVAAAISPQITYADYE